MSFNRKAKRRPKLINSHFRVIKRKVWGARWDEVRKNPDKRFDCTPLLEALFGPGTCDRVWCTPSEYNWLQYDDEDLYVPLEETVHQGREDTYTSEEMFYMSEEEREKIVRSAIVRDSGVELCLFDEDLDDAYADEEGIWGFCESKKLLIRDYFGTIEDGYHHNYHEAYLVESKRSDYKGLMGIVYFPFSLDDDLIEECGEDVRLVVLDMELKKAS